MLYRILKGGEYGRLRIRLNRWDWAWLAARGGDRYIESRLVGGDCVIEGVGEISEGTLAGLRSWCDGGSWEWLVEAVHRETGVITWGEEGSLSYWLGIQFLRRERLLELRDYCFVSGRDLGEVLKGVILRERGHRVYRVEIPYRNRLGVVALRKLLRRHGGQRWMYWCMNKLMGGIYDW